MVLNFFCKSRSHDRDPLFAYKLNTDARTVTKAFVERHLDAIYAELNEDLDNRSTRSNQFPLLSDQQFRSPSRSGIPNDTRSHHTHQRPQSSVHYDTTTPQQIPNELRQQHDSDGQNSPEREGHCNDGGSLQDMEFRDTTPLPPPPIHRPNPAQEAPFREPEDDHQHIALRTSIREAFTPNTNLTPLPTPPAPRASANPRLGNASHRYPSRKSYPPRESFRSTNQVDKRASRASGHEHSGYHGNIYRPVSRDSIQGYPNESEDLKEAKNKILHWVKACLKRLEQLPGGTIENFRLTLSVIPPDALKLGERYIPELEKLANRLERFYWRIMKYEDFFYIRSCCSVAQTRVETWSKYLTLAKDLSSME